jgi:hypothetical protein
MAGMSTIPSIARLDVTDLSRLATKLLICDIDHTMVDPLVLLRQMRFVLPKCLIAVDLRWRSRP